MMEGFQEFSRIFYRRLLNLLHEFRFSGGLLLLNSHHNLHKVASVTSSNEISRWLLPSAVLIGGPFAIS